MTPALRSQPSPACLCPRPSGSRARSPGAVVQLAPHQREREEEAACRGGGETHQAAAFTGSWPRSLGRTRPASLRRVAQAPHPADEAEN